MEIKIVHYYDSCLLDEQTDQVAKIEEVSAIGFVIEDNSDEIVLAREFMGKEFRGQIAIPKKVIFSVETLR